MVITTHVNGVRNRWEWVRLDNLEQDEIEALMNVPVYPIRRTGEIIYVNGPRYHSDSSLLSESSSDDYSVNDYLEDEDRGYFYADRGNFSERSSSSAEYSDGQVSSGDDLNDEGVDDNLPDQYTYTVDENQDITHEEQSGTCTESSYVEDGGEFYYYLTEDSGDEQGSVDDLNDDGADDLLDQDIYSVDESQEASEEEKSEDDSGEGYDGDGGEYDDYLALDSDTSSDNDDEEDSSDDDDDQIQADNGEEMDSSSEFDEIASTGTADTEPLTECDSDDAECAGCIPAAFPACVTFPLGKRSREDSDSTNQESLETSDPESKRARVRPTEAR